MLVKWIGQMPNARPSKFVKLGQEVNVVVLDVQETKA